VSEEARGVAARIGIVALNLVAPGLGLLRVQAGRAAAMFLIAPLALLALVIIAYLILPTLTFASWATLLGFTLAALLAVYVIAIVRSWHLSARLLPPGPWWSRWYGMTGILLVTWTLTGLLPDFTQSTYKSFYIPSESMLPTFDVGDKVVARMSPPAAPSRGDLILVDNGSGGIYLKRVAGLPGDRIGVIDGIVYLNGRPIAQRLVGQDRVQPDIYGNIVRRLAEQFPGEASPHEIYDAGDSSGDHFDEVIVAPGHVFLLGDNRDHSADSRFSHEEQGLEQVKLADVRGTPLFFYWTSGRHRIGDSASH
jgi:signal peptidase I